MPAPKSEKIKLYIVVGLLCVAVIVAYFRFGRKKTAPGTNIAKSSPQELTFDVSQIKKPGLKKRARKHESAANESLSMNIRDIFSPVRLPIASESPPPPEQPPMPTGDLVLKGTIIGRKNPMAIINGKFVHIGDKIGAYKIVKIDSDDVILRANGHEKVLHVLTPEGK